MRPDDRQRVLDSALDLCGRHALSDIGLDQLARAAGVSSLDIVRSIGFGAVNTPSGLWAPFVVLEWLEYVDTSADRSEELVPAHTHEGV